MMGRSSGSGAKAAASAASEAPLNILDAKKVSSSGLPRAPVSAFRKKPVKLQYDLNEYHMFRLPSEKAFLFGSFDYNDLFGRKKGVTHSPHLQAQVDLDTRLLWLIGGITLEMLCTEFKRQAEFQPLRENFRNNNLGRFELSDFKEK